MPDSIYVHDTGSGPAVVLLHGTPSPSSAFDPLVARLEGRCRVLMPDLPGYGRSRPLDGRCTLPRIREALEDSLAALDVKEAAVVGFSGGTYLSFALALAGRLRVTRLVQLAPIAGPSEQERPLFRQFAGMLRSQLPTALEPIMVQRMLSEGFAQAHPEACEEAKRWLYACPAEVLAAELEAMADADNLLERLPTITVPVLLRLGELDIATPRGPAEEMAKRLPKASLQVVPGKGHALSIEDAGPTWNAVEAFLIGE